jgi:hypothetical protein
VWMVSGCRRCWFAGRWMPSQLVRWDLLGVTLSYLWGKVNSKPLPLWARSPLYRGTGCRCVLPGPVAAYFVVFIAVPLFRGHVRSVLTGAACVVGRQRGPTPSERISRRRVSRSRAIRACEISSLDR